MPQQLIKYGNIIYDPNEQVLRQRNGKELKLRPKSLQVFLLLAENTGELVTKEEIITAVWEHVFVTDDSLIQCIADIRRVLQDTNRKIIKTVPRKGYIFFPPQSVIKADTSAELLPVIGRKKELTELELILQNPECRLLMMLGLGGVGKSSLALALKNKLKTSGQYPDGVYFISLANLQRPEHIPEAIAGKLGISLQGMRSPVETLIETLQSRDTLLILDNVEHLLPNAKVCLTLLQACPTLNILLTSRLPSQLPGEWIYQLHGFKLPAKKGDFVLSAAYRLFTRTAQRTNHSFQPEEVENSHIQEICRLVGGMPLGIEIAARWIQHLSCEEIVTEMSQYLSNIRKDSDSDSDTNQPATLSNVLRQSWNMLTDREQTIMQTLALFRENFTREAAAATTGIGIDDYSGLISKSVLTRNSQGRYVLHEVMRRYANKRRSLNPTQHLKASKRFFDYHLAIARDADTGILGGKQLNTITLLKSEQANLRECLSLCHPEYTSKPLSHVAGLELVGSLGIFWFLANHWQEGRQWASNFLSLSSKSSCSDAKAKALLAAGNLSIVLDDYTAADKYLKIGTEMSADAGISIQYARGLAAMGVLRRLQGRLDEAIDCGRRSMHLFEAAGEQGGCQFNLGNVGHALLMKGEYDEAMEALEQCIHLNQHIGLTLGMPYALVNLGRLHWKLQQVVAARLYLQRAVEISEKMGVILYRAQALSTLGWIEISQLNFSNALKYLQNSAQDYMRLGETGGLADCMRGIAVVKTQTGELILAIQFISSAEKLTKSQKLSTTNSHQAESDHTAPQLNLKLQELTGISTNHQKLLDDTQVAINKGVKPEALRNYRNLAMATSPEELLRDLGT